MSKLYEKNERLFAIICIVIYVVVFGSVRKNYGENSIYSLITLLIFTGLILLFLGKNKLWGNYGLTSWPAAKKYLFFIPFLLMVSVNLWNGAVINYSGMGQIYAVCSMALVGFLEEIIFRGILFKAIEKQSINRAIVISAVTFGVGHIVNLLTGHATVDTILQMCYAVAIGFSFVMVYYKSNSLLPCIITHSLIDITSTFYNDMSGDTLAAIDYIGAIFLLVVAGGYTLYIHKKVDMKL